MMTLLFGKNGHVGWELNRSLQSLGNVIALSRELQILQLQKAFEKSYKK